MFRVRVAKAHFNTMALTKAFERAAHDQQIKFAKMIVKSAKLSMRKAPIRIGPRGGIHYIPSKPGKPPHIRTGTLKRDILAVQLRKSVVIRQGTKGWYGLVHEFGGKRHPPRPYIGPAIRRVTPRFPSMFSSMNIKRTYNSHGLSEVIRLEGGE